MSKRASGPTSAPTACFPLCNFAHIREPYFQRVMASPCARVGLESGHLPLELEKKDVTHGFYLW